MTESHYTIDAQGKSIGRVASQIAFRLQGKHLPNYRPNRSPSTMVKVINVKKVIFTGSKLDLNKIHKSSGYPGGLKSITLRQAFNRAPEQVVKRIVSNMLPNNRLKTARLKRLLVEL